MSALASDVTSKVAEDSQTWYSWVGLKIFKLVVKGFYTTDGTSIVDYSGTTAQASTWLLWSSRAADSFWTLQTPSRCKVYGEANFVLGIATEENSIGLQNVWKSLVATGRP